MSKAQAALSANADALDDDFELDDNLVASGNDSDEEEARAQASTSGSRKPARKTVNPLDVEVEDEFALDDEAEEEDLDNVPRASQSEDEYGLPVNKKRKVEGKTDGPASQGQQKLTPEEKKKKRKEKSKAAKRKRLDAIDEAESETSTSLIAVQPPQLQADYLAEMQSQAMPKMSSIEMEDFRIAETYLSDTSSILHRDSLKEFIKTATKLGPTELKAESVEQPGSPKLLVVSGAALRVADVVRELKDLAGKGEVAKLFAKHFKLAQHCSYCKETKFSIGAGTPDRILKLIEADALLLDNTSHLILDLKKDSKKRHILDIPESRLALYKLLSSPKVMQRMKDGNLKLLMY